MGSSTYAVFCSIRSLLLRSGVRRAQPLAHSYCTDCSPAARYSTASQLFPCYTKHAWSYFLCPRCLRECPPSKQSRWGALERPLKRTFACGHLRHPWKLSPAACLLETARLLWVHKKNFWFPYPLTQNTAYLLSLPDAAVPKHRGL